MAMITDPNTGLITNEPTYQPTGAMGAVLSLLNAQKAGQIASTLQQQRENQAQMGQAQLGEYQSKMEREQQLRDLMGSLPPDTPIDQRISTILGSGLADMGPYLPYARAGESAQARRDVAETQAAGRENVENIRQGTTGAPLPLAKAGQATGIGAAAQAKAAQTEEITPALVDATRALAALRRAKAQLSGVQAATAGQLSALYRNVAQYDRYIKDLTVDKYGMEIEPTPAVTALINQYKAEKASLLQMIVEKSTPTATGGKTGAQLLPPDFLGGASPEQKATAGGAQNPTAAPASVQPTGSLGLMLPSAP